MKYVWRATFHRHVNMNFAGVDYTSGNFYVKKYKLTLEWLNNKSDCVETKLII